MVMRKKKKIDENIVINQGIMAKIETWDKVSEDYKIEIDQSEYQLAEEIIKIFEKKDIKVPARIIELGCGSGHLSACLAMKGYKVTLLDFSKGALQKAEDTFKYYDLEGDFIEGDIFNLSTLNKTYDLAWNSGVMEHFSSDNLLRIYNSIMSVTKNRFIFLVPNPNSIAYLMMRYYLQGKNEWIYGMEYLRNDYLKLAEKLGFYGSVIGYAAGKISQWHFESTFADCENAKMYSRVLEDGLMPEDEAYLVAYEMVKNADVEIKLVDMMQTVGGGIRKKYLS